MKKETTQGNHDAQIIKLDARNRIALTKVSRNLAQVYRVHEEGDRIILEPVREIPKEERWLLDPANKTLVAELKKALKNNATVPLSEVKKKLGWK